jgi:hypothetical protein
MPLRRGEHSFGLINIRKGRTYSEKSSWVDINIVLHVAIWGLGADRGVPDTHGLSVRE